MAGLAKRDAVYTECLTLKIEICWNGRGAFEALIALDDARLKA